MLIITSQNKSYFDKDSVNKFAYDIIDKGACCSKILNRNFNKSLVMTKENYEELKIFTKSWINKTRYKKKKCQSKRPFSYHWKIQKLINAT